MVAVVPTFITEVFSCFSRLANVLSGGSSDMTLSARAHRDGLKIEAYIDWFFLKVFREKNHCRRWWVAEIERSLNNIQQWELRRDEQRTPRPG